MQTNSPGLHFQIDIVEGQQAARQRASCSSEQMSSRAPSDTVGRLGSVDGQQKLVRLRRTRSRCVIHRGLDMVRSILRVRAHCSAFLFCSARTSFNSVKS